MIVNPERLYEGCPPGTVQAYKLRLLEHYLLRPLADEWTIRLTSVYRSTQAQAALVSARKARGTSQHSLGEAVDFVPEGSIHECYQWCLEHLRPWQLLLEYTGTMPECIHISIPSEQTEIVSKRLLFYSGAWVPFSGTFPTVTT